MTSKIKVDNIENQCGGAVVTKCGGTTTISGTVVKSNTLQASDAGNIISQSGTTITLGATGDNIVLAGGATQSGFGRTGTVDWITTPKTATFTAVSGEGYFCNTSGGVITANLPAGVAGAIVSFADYAGTWQTNNVTVAPNGTDKIGSTNANATLNVEGQSVTFVFVDSTQGWINTMDSTSNVRGAVPFVAATGGTITTVDTDYKVHTFTGPGTFTVTNAGTPSGSNEVSYLVIAGGGGGGSSFGGGGGGGGFREGKTPQCTYTSSPVACTSGSNNGFAVAVQGYPITVGGGGAAPGSRGSESIINSLTSTGGGGGGVGGCGGGTGGSGGGASYCTAGGAGNTPPVSPAQGQPGGGPGAPNSGSGGGGTGVTGTAGYAHPGGGTGGGGGNGVSTSITGSSVTRGGGGGGGGTPTGGPAAAPGAGGGSGGSYGCNAISPGVANTGGGGGGTGPGSSPQPATNGGSGVVIVRYKFQ